MLTTTTDICLALLHIRSTQIGPCLHSLAALLSHCSIRGIMPVINRALIRADNNDDHYEALAERQEKANKIYDTFRNYGSIPI